MSNTPARVMKLTHPIQRGDDVKYVQYILDALGIAVPCNGEFDQKTHEAVCKFQFANGLKVDGVVGEKTLALLKSVEVTDHCSVVQRG